MPRRLDTGAVTRSGEHPNQLKGNAQTEELSRGLPLLARAVAASTWQGSEEKRLSGVKSKGGVVRWDSSSPRPKDGKAARKRRKAQQRGGAPSSSTATSFEGDDSGEGPLQKERLQRPTEGEVRDVVTDRGRLRNWSTTIRRGKFLGR